MKTTVAAISHLVVFLLMGFVLPAPPVAAEETIRVGVLAQRTGSNPALTQAFDEGISWALDRINGEQGGVLGKRLEVVLEDSGGTPERAAAALHKLVTVDGVILTVGETHSQSGMAVAQAADGYHHPLIVAEALADDITARNSRYVFRAGPCNSGIIQDTLLGFISANHFRRIALVHEDTDFGRSAVLLIDGALKGLGLETLVQPLTSGNSGAGSSVAGLKAFAPELIIVLHYGVDLANVEAQIQAAGFAAPVPLLFSGPSLAGTWSRPGPKGPPPSQLSLYAARLHPAVDFTEASRLFRQAYQDKFGNAVSDYRVRSIYDVLLIAADALRRAGSGDSEQLVAALEQTHLEVASGVVQFGQEPGSYRYHHWQPPLLVVQWQEQSPVVVYPLEVATGNLRR